ncbi:MAG: D-2-hydroxyacid dehydrogenase [Xanthomonadales bacterium]|nr:D-2-hydroxyacid dehydrogenase [Xanthomonadales bacterium]
MRLSLLLLLFTSPLLALATDESELIGKLGIRETSAASRDMAGWRTPKRIALLDVGVPASGVGSLDWFAEAAGDVPVTLIDPQSAGDASSADVLLGWCSPTVIEAAESLRYLHVFSAGLDGCMRVEGIADRGLITTNSAKAASETIAEHAIALTLALSRNVHLYHQAQMESRWQRGFGEGSRATALTGKTMLVLGLGGIGSQVARRANALGMRVIATRNSSRSGPDYVDYVGLSGEMHQLAAQADAVVNALPLTGATAGVVDEAFFAALKDGAYYVSVGRGGTTDTAALMSALNSGKLGGAGLDVTDPEPLPDGHPLWQTPNVIITPHTAASSALSVRNTMLIARENLRRYVAGEPLLNLVDLARGY